MHAEIHAEVNIHIYFDLVEQFEIPIYNMNAAQVSFKYCVLHSVKASEPQLTIFGPNSFSPYRNIAAVFTIVQEK